MTESSVVVLPACDVVVVGGGIAGLTAAFALQQEGKRVEMFEQEAVLGGRVCTDPTRLGIEYGAAYFGPLQSYTMRFAELLQLERLSNDLDLNFYHRTEWSNGQLLKFDKRSFAVPPGTSGELLKSFGLLGGFFDPSQMQHEQVVGMANNEQALFSAIAELETLVLQLRCFLDAPWQYPKAKMLDAMSVEDWIANQYTNTHVQDLLRVGVRSALSTETSEISMLYLLYYCATGGSFVNVMAVGGGADSYRFKDGASAMVTELGKAIRKDPTIRAAMLIQNPHPAVTVRESMRVTHLQHRTAPEGVTVTARSANGGAYTIDAQHVIVATTPTLRNSISTDGSMTSFPTTAMGMGQTIKTFATFNRPWWKEERGASGYALSARNTPDSPVVWTMDNSWRDKDVLQHCLMGFIVGARAKELASKTTAERKKIVLEHWSRIVETPTRRLTLPARTSATGTGARRRAAAALRRSSDQVNSTNMVRCSADPTVASIGAEQRQGRTGSAATSTARSNLGFGRRSKPCSGARSREAGDGAPRGCVRGARSVAPLRFTSLNTRLVCARICTWRHRV